MTLLATLTALYLAVGPSPVSGGLEFALPDSVSCVEVRLVPPKRPKAITLDFNGGLSLKMDPEADFSPYQDASHNAMFTLFKDDMPIATTMQSLLPEEPITFGIAIPSGKNASIYSYQGSESSSAPTSSPISFPNKFTLSAPGSTLIHAVALKEPEAITHRQTIDIESLVINSKDPMSAYWTYLDRENDPHKARPGGQYTLLTLPAEKPGEYYIIYVSGATTLPELWTKGMVKGYMTPTTFKGQYNLRWTTSDPAVILDNECHARIDDNGMILTLEFPLFGSRLRFQRSPAKP